MGKLSRLVRGTILAAVDIVICGRRLVRAGACEARRLSARAPCSWHPHKQRPWCRCRRSHASGSAVSRRGHTASSGGGGSGGARHGLRMARRKASSASSLTTLPLAGCNPHTLAPPALEIARTYGSRRHHFISAFKFGTELLLNTRLSTRSAACALIPGIRP